MMKKIKWNIAVAILYSLICTQGCSPILVLGRISAATYQPPPTNATFFVVPGDKVTLTEKNIQNFITNEMEKIGFRRTTNLADADLAIVYSYSIGAGITSISSSPDFVWGGQKVESPTKYPRYFYIGIIDRAKTNNPKDPVFIWEAEIYSSGSSSNIAWLAESFIPQLFKYYGKNVINKIFIAS